MNVFFFFFFSFSFFVNLLKKGLYKYDQEIYEIFMDSFDLIPLVCIINGKFLGVHGGLSPHLKTVKIIIEIYI